MDERNKHKNVGGVKSAIKTDDHIQIIYETGEEGRLHILSGHVFKYYMSPNGKFLDYPIPNDPEDIAKINSKKISDYDTKDFKDSYLENKEHAFIVHMELIRIAFDKIKGTMAVYSKIHNKDVFKEAQPLLYNNENCIQYIHQHKSEFFFGGGMQNGRFSHKGEIIEIVNTNNWIDGGVTSPCPFYWSTKGFGILRNTWKPGSYDFGKTLNDLTQTMHKEGHFDAFFFINSTPKDLLSDYFELTGRPLFMPEYAFYEAHLNAFNRDYWVKVTPDEQGAILFEDGEYYKSYQPKDIGDRGGILESLNGENNNYQFSARAMLDRYKLHDMPLGWFVPNDGYGSGYGQTDSLDGDIQNLTEFANYARISGVQLALWTESNLRPVDPNHPKKGERDLAKEVSKAGVVALKCDVAWIGDGYSFGLNAVEYASKLFIEKTKQNTRPLIIMVDGWAGTQRHAGIWSGDQTGGQWEYIRFHIPTYIGTGLSGQPIVGSDMDGIYGGKEREVNIRDYQWKTFTPLQLNMDGWGRIPKTPFSFDKEASNINRAYLKLKSMLMPYNYTIGHESIHKLPMIRAMFLEFPHCTVSHTKAVQYQYMWGPNILVAPIYSDTKCAETKMSIRNEIYLPDSNQVWVDFFSGEKYQGGKMINNMIVPLWKIPVFIKEGAIIPMTNPNNNPSEIKRDKRIFNLYPKGHSQFIVYEDDGLSSDYKKGLSAYTKITTTGPDTNVQGSLVIKIDETKGSYETMIKDRKTEIRVMSSKKPEKIKVAINGDNIIIKEVKTQKEYDTNDNVYWFNENFISNPYLKDLGGKEVLQKFILLKIEKINVFSNMVHIKINGYFNESRIHGNISNKNTLLETPKNLIEVKEETSPSSITVSWKPVKGAHYYEIEKDTTLFTNLIQPLFTFDEFGYETKHAFRIRSVNDDGYSEWSDIVEATTKSDPHKNTVKNVKVSCNIPCQPSQEVCKLTDGDCKTMWHTVWGNSGKSDPEKGHILKINFDLGSVYEIDKIEYVPRSDAGNGTFLSIQYRFSTDGENWSRMSDEIVWPHDAEVKYIPINGIKMRFVDIHVLNAIGNYGSGNQILFHKKIN